MKKLLLIEEDPRLRLRLSTLLRPTCDVVTPQPGEDPLRASRLLAAELALLVLHPHQAENCLRLCRMMKTDLAPIRHVAIYAPDTGPPPEEVLGPWMADGYLGGEPDEEGLRAFLEAVQRGTKPCISPPPPPRGILRKLLHRLRRG